MITGYTEEPPIKFDNNVLNAGQAGIDNLAQAFTIGNTYLLSSNVVQSFRVAGNRIAVHRFGLPFSVMRMSESICIRTCRTTCVLP
jgi:hypothetical protein